MDLRASRAVDGTEDFEIDAVRDYSRDRRIGSELTQPLRECVADGDVQPARPRSTTDHRARQRVLRDEIQVGAPRRDRERQVERARNPGRGDAIRIEVVRVDQVEAAPAMQPRHAVAHAQGHERRGQTHPEPRHDRVARVMNIDPGYQLGSRDSRELRVASETRIRAREPWHRRDHRRLDLARREQLLQAAKDEETMGRLLGIGEETGKRQHAQRTLARQTGGGARTSRAGFP